MDIKIRKKIAVGMFHYADEDVFFQYDAHKTVMAVVAYVIDKGFFSICLDQQKMPWSSDKLKLSICSELSGREATKLVVDNACIQGKKAEAAFYCATYHQNGVVSGRAFLPSATELTHFFENREAIDKSFKLLGVSPLFSMLSVTAPCEDCVCCCSPFGVRYAETKASFFVRPALFTEFN